MAAPALVLLARGSNSHLSAEVAHAMRVRMQELHPEVSVHTAFLDQCPPSGPHVVSRLARGGVDEIVFVPMDLSATFGVDPEVQAMVEGVRLARPGVRMAVSRPVGPEASLLNLVDQRLRAALAAAHVSELDGLVLSAVGTHEPRSQSLLSRRARQWSVHHRLPVIGATASGSAPGPAAAIASLRAQGRRHIAVGSLFITPNDLYHQQAEQARRAGAVAVSEPLGAADELLEIAWGRYAVAAMGLIDFGIEEHHTDDTPGRHLHVVAG